ncbi:MAG: hypothetical protein LUE24_13915 [Lachnospiraceae bacterium]|nr:hypothetical protein [Lachnospiraceae bacterium]
MAITRRNAIKRDLEKKLEEKSLTSPIYRSQLDQYMKWYDQLENLNRQTETLRGGSMRTYIDCLKEARQLQKSMQGILDWLGVVPDAEPDEEQESYDL